MLLILVSDSKKEPNELEKDVESIKSAMKIMSRGRAKEGEYPPMIMTLTGYKVYAIPGTVEEVSGTYDEETGTSIIKLNMKNIYDMEDE